MMPEYDAICIFNDEDGTIRVEDAPEKTVISLSLIGAIVVRDEMYKFIRIQGRIMTIKAKNGTFKYRFAEVTEFRDSVIADLISVTTS
jgi:hypothetical protein